MKRRFAKLPPALAAKIEACGAVRTATGWLIDVDTDSYRKHFGKSPQSTPARIRRKAEELKPVPRDQWPQWAIDISAGKIDGERGIGDTAERLSGCKHCAARTRRWNVKYAYP